MTVCVLIIIDRLVTSLFLSMRGPIERSHVEPREHWAYLISSCSEPQIARDIPYGVDTPVQQEASLTWELNRNANNAKHAWTPNITCMTTSVVLALFLILLCSKDRCIAAFQREGPVYNASSAYITRDSVLKKCIWLV